MTLEAWVRPQAATDWRTVIFKESAGGVAYALYANSDTDVPSANLGGDPGARGSQRPRPGQVVHLAATYDSTTLRLFVNGTQVGSRDAARRARRPARAARSPSAPTTSGASASAASSTRSAIYNRALSAGRARRRTWASRWCRARPRRRPIRAPT